MVWVSLSKFHKTYKGYSRITSAYADRISQTLFEELDKKQQSSIRFMAILFSAYVGAGLNEAVVHIAEAIEISSVCEVLHLSL